MSWREEKKEEGEKNARLKLCTKLWPGQVDVSLPVVVVVSLLLLLSFSPCCPTLVVILVLVVVLSLAQHLHSAFAVQKV